MTRAGNVPPAPSAPGADRGARSSSRAQPAPSGLVAQPRALESLAPRFVPEQHATYLRYLEDAVADPRNLNIALTGRYGTGKSSVLDKFEESHRAGSLRIAISTLGPDSEGTTLTNLIQKELVKRLLYRARSRDLRFSRFNRIVPLSRKRAAARSLAAVGVAGFTLALLRWLPAIAGTGPHHTWPVRLASWAVFATLSSSALTAVQLVIHGRFIVSNVSAVGATVTLAQSTSTYFDEYLDEIVYFFDEISPDIVIFEDLDRFDDPHIFETLRELNALLNQTARRREKGKPLRFVYAIKDSLFERLGSGTEQIDDDAAVVENARANRTKFFDIVIPLVPFISHRNARELLADVLKERGFADLDRALVALVAQHATDMRLLRNIGNEYAVFAERLINSTRTAPGLNADSLFALVAYKNFHLHDFEEISRRNSDLDRLYEQRLALVREAIEELEDRKRDILAHPERHKAMQVLANRSGEALIAYGTAVRAHSGNASWPLTFQIPGHGEHRPQDVARTYEFWADLAKANQVSIGARHPNGAIQPLSMLNSDQIRAMFPGVSDAGEWFAIDEDANAQSVHKIDADVAFLRGADFGDLAGAPRFTLLTNDGARSFTSLIDAAISSQLGRELVKRGYLNRNFTLYAAQFYGDFSGVDVANFVVQSVQPNRMDIDYTFTGPAAIANLLAEVPSDFSRTVSAYNIEILDYLLEQGDPRASEIAGTLVSRPGTEAQAFLRAYLNSGSARARLAQILAGLPWLEVLVFLVQDPDVPADARPVLVDAALRGSRQDAPYTLGSGVRTFLVDNYLGMAAFTTPQDPQTVDTVAALIKQAGAALPVLAGLDHGLLECVVRDDLYILTADNLREALATPEDVGFDRVIENPGVYRRCLANPAEYLGALEDDPKTPYAVFAEEVLVRVLTDADTVWDTGAVDELIAQAAAESRLEDLGRAPTACWSGLAQHHLFRPTVQNLRAYCDSVGSIDASVAVLLDRAGSIDTVGQSDAMQERLAIDILNAADAIPDASWRVSLVAGMELSNYLPPGKIEPKAGELFTLLLAEDIIDDSYEAFAQFGGAGWETIEPAIVQSSRFAEFMAPELVGGYIRELLGSKAVPPTVADLVVDDLARYLPADDRAALAAAGRHASARGLQLPVDQLQRIAGVTGDHDLAIRLVAAASPLPSPSELVAILVSLGEPYGNLIDETRSEFKVPNTDEYRAVFEHLKEVGVVTEFRKQRGREWYTMKPAAP